MIVPLVLVHNIAGAENVAVGGAVIVTFCVKVPGKQVPLLGVTFNVTG